MKLGNIKRLLREDLPDIPKGEWADIWLNNQNQANEQIVQALQSGLTFGDNFNAVLRSYRFTHGVARTIPVPDQLSGVPVAIDCWGCKQVPGTTRVPIDHIDWQPADNPDPKGPRLITITPYFQRTISGAVGDMLGPITRVRSSGTPITPTGTTVNVCTTTSITLTAGRWQVRGAVGYQPAATTSVTVLAYGVSATSATLPGADTIAVPTNGEIRFDQNSAAGFVPGGEVTYPIPSYRVTVATGATLPLFLVALAGFGVSTIKVFGSLEAEREVEAYSDSAPQGDLLLFFSGG